MTALWQANKVTLTVNFIMKQIFTFLLVIIAGCSYSQLRQKDLAKIMSKYRIPGISLTYIVQGKVTENLAIGIRNQTTKSKVDLQTVFSAASLSKPVFAYAVMQLVNQNRLSLDTPLFRYYSYPDLEYEPRAKLITARMILSHTSGLPNWRRGDSLKFQYEPGQRFRYSGEGYVYLAKVIEKITGKPIEVLMQEMVFQPLGMTRSSYIWQKSFEPDFASPHNDDGETEEDFFPESANVAASLQTSAQDYAKFLIALMNSENLRPELFREMFQPQQIARMQKEGDELFWALGMAYQKTNDGIGFWQWGDNGNWKAFVMMYPDRKEALVFFTNSTRGLDAAKQILSLFFKGPQPSLNWLKEH